MTHMSMRTFLSQPRTGERRGILKEYSSRPSSELAQRTPGSATTFPVTYALLREDRGHDAQVHTAAPFINILVAACPHT